MRMINRLKNESKKYWIVYYIDHDKKTFNPGLQVSDWAVVQEIERMTCELIRDGKKVTICTTPTAFCIDDLWPQKIAITKGPSDYSYDPFLIW